MWKQNMSIIVLQIFLLALTKITTAQPQEPQLDFALGHCLKNENISTISTYHSNIVTLLSNLQSFSSVNKFFTSSSGLGPDLVNGYYLCRPDLSLSTCQDCVNAIINKINKYCLDRKEASVWYDECMLRYTNNSISPTEGNGTDPWYSDYSLFNVSKPEGFPTLVNTTMRELISQAIMPDRLHRFFAYGQKNYTVFEGFYGMVLCRPDITAEACESCLLTALSRIPSCCVNSWAEYIMVMQPNCQLRYDTAPFIFPSQQPLSTPPSSLPPVPSPP